MSRLDAKDGPVGVFDSGIGGLTVLAEIQRMLPAEDLFYIGDTARVPYGGKSPETVLRYSREISKLLLDRGAKAVVAACNTASALAVPQLATELSVPVIGVVEPGARAAVAATRNRHAGVIGTRATIASRAYESAIRAADPRVHVVSAACPLLVPLAEEGWFDEPETLHIARRYLAPLVADGIDTLVLGCTHYPLLAKCLAKAVGPGVTLVNSAQNCALALARTLERFSLAKPLTPHRKSTTTAAFTDEPGNFLQVALDALALRLDRLEHVPLND